MKKSDIKEPTNLLPQGFNPEDYEDERFIALEKELAIWKPDMPVPCRGYVLAMREHPEKVTPDGEVMKAWAQLEIVLTRPTMAKMGEEVVRVEKDSRVLVTLSHGLTKLRSVAAGSEYTLEVILKGIDKVNVPGTVRKVWRWRLDVLPAPVLKRDVAPEIAAMRRIEESLMLMPKREQST